MAKKDIPAHQAAFILEPGTALSVAHAEVIRSFNPPCAYAAAVIRVPWPGLLPKVHRGEYPVAHEIVIKRLNWRSFRHGYFLHQHHAGNGVAD